jgi:hypothetical protein
MTNHFLSTYVAHCIRKKGVLKPRELALDQSHANDMSNQSSSMGMGGGGQMIVDQVGSNRHMSSGHMQGGYQGGADDLRRTILSLMSELRKTSQFISKASIYGMLQNKVDQGTFEKELDRMVEDGVICQGHDSDHFAMVDE